VALGHPKLRSGLSAYDEGMKVPPELRPWMWLVWSGGIFMMWLSSCSALSCSLGRDRKKAEDATRAFYASEAAGNDPSASFGDSSRRVYQELLNKYGRAQKVIEIQCVSALGGVSSSCHAYVQREKSKSFEAITILGRNGVCYVSKDKYPPFKQASPKQQPLPHVPSHG